MWVLGTNLIWVEETNIMWVIMVEWLKDYMWMLP